MIYTVHKDVGDLTYCTYRHKRQSIGQYIERFNKLSNCGLAEILNAVLARALLKCSLILYLNQIFLFDRVINYWADKSIPK